MFDSRSPEEMIVSEGYDLVAGTVLESDSIGVNRHPPGCRVRVDEVFNGEVRPGRELRVRWRPTPLFLLCGTGEDAHVAQWGRTALPGPVVGARWISAGVRSANGQEWISFERLRWMHADSLRDYFRQESSSWTRALRRMRREFDDLLGPGIRQLRRDHAERAAQAVEEERRWLDTAEHLAADADLRRLSLAADQIAIGELTLPDFPTRRDAVLRVTEHLAGFRAVEAESTLQLFAAQREDSVVSFWSRRPPDLRPGPDSGRPVRCIAFLCRSLMPVWAGEPRPAYRLVDGRSGLLLADAETVQRLRRILKSARTASGVRREVRPQVLGTGSTIADSELGSVAIKFTPLNDPSSPTRRARTLIVTSLLKAVEGGTGWFLSRAAPFVSYRSDFSVPNRTFGITHSEVRSLLDSLATLQGVGARGIAPNWNLSISVRTVASGNEAEFELTLDEDQIPQLGRIFARVLRAGPLPPSSEGAVFTKDVRTINIEAWLESIGHGALEAFAVARAQ
ncbi:MAG: hypothetical protein HOP12_05295 [Candidatus Eisenbacteria bacterium]|uniref:Uncharacterized protein n=1 Tax=Eiseniibacteriota bacterium TaxID=2212470 RepID=A0A849SGI7_UNCEI|nr:hypothetical protein [Candidatus Eisenbacteria bacterium]